MSAPGILEPVASGEFGSAGVFGVDGSSPNVAVFKVDSPMAQTGSTQGGPETCVPVDELARTVAELAEQVNVVVFLDRAEVSSVVVEAVTAMLARWANDDLDAVVCHVMATEAIKRVDEAGLVVSGLDRSSLVAVRSPEVVGRSALERALAINANHGWCSPTELVAASGGSVALFPAPELGSGPEHTSNKSDHKSDHNSDNKNDKGSGND